MKPERGGVLSVRFRSFSRLFRKTTIVSNLCVCVGGGAGRGHVLLKCFQCSQNDCFKGHYHSAIINLGPIMIFYFPCKTCSNHWKKESTVNVTFTV